MKPFESVLGELKKERNLAVVLPIFPMGESFVKGCMREKYGESVVCMVRLFEWGRSYAIGFLVRTESRLLFCISQDLNVFENSFEIKWVVHDLQDTVFDVRLVAENEVQVAPGMTVLFSPELISARRLVDEIRGMIRRSPPKQQSLTQVEAEGERTGKERVNLNVVLKAIESVAFIPPMRVEKDYRAQLYQALRDKYHVEYETWTRRGRFDLVLGDGEVAVELKIVRDSSVFNSLFGQINQYKDEVRGIVVVLINRVKNPGIIERGKRRLQELDHEKIRVVVKE